jgi:hypothetical protein
MAFRRKKSAKQEKGPVQKVHPAGPARRNPVALAQHAEQHAVQRAGAQSGLARPADILALQRAAGNGAVLGLIQAKLTVGPVGDRHEQQADRVAEQVLNTHLPSPARRGAGSEVQRQEEEEEVTTQPLVQRQDEEELQAKPLVQRQPGGSLEAGAELEGRLSAQRGRGSPLPDDARAFMAPRFGADFGGVRIHTGGEAVQMSKELKAQAFTHGQDVYFGAGRYEPATDAGKRLLAHELTHVVQQGGGGSTSSLPRDGKHAPIQQHLSRIPRIQRNPGKNGDDDEKKRRRKAMGWLDPKMAKRLQQFIKKREKESPPRKSKPPKKPPALPKRRSGRQKEVVIEITDPEKKPGKQRWRPKLKPRGKPPLVSQTIEIPEKPVEVKSPYQAVSAKIVSHISTLRDRSFVTWTKTDLTSKGGKKPDKAYVQIGDDLNAYRGMPENSHEQEKAKNTQGTDLLVAIAVWKSKNKPGFFAKLFKDKKKDRREALTTLHGQVTADGQRLNELSSTHRLKGLCEKAERMDAGPPPKTESGAQTAITDLRVHILRELPRDPKDLVKLLRQQVENSIARLNDLRVRFEKEAKEKELSPEEQEKKRTRFLSWVEQQVKERGLAASGAEKSLEFFGHKLEALDKWHRDYNSLNVLFESWVAEKTEDSFFDWVDNWEKKNRKLSRTRYITDEGDQKRYRLGFRGVQPWYEDRMPPKLAKYESGPDKQGIYVMTPSGEFYARREDDIRKATFHHSSFLAGLPVGAAGKMKAESGKLAINLESGHYQPRVRHMLNAVRGLKQKGVPLGQLKVQPFIEEVSPLTWPAKQFKQELESLKKSNGQVGGLLAKLSAIKPIAGEQVREAYQAYEPF